MWYTPVEPPARLRHLLACSWTAYPSGTHLLSPDGCTDLLWLSTGRLVYCGPEVRPWTFALPAGTTAVGVRFLPGAANAVFDLDQRSVFDQRVPFSRIVSDETARRWERALGDAAGLSNARDTLVDLVAAHQPNATPPQAVSQIVTMLMADPNTTTAKLAIATGLHARTLQRRSLQWFGYGTATLGRIIRFHRFLAVMSAEEIPPSLAVAAATAGYFDQSHLARDCRTITGMSPGAFLAEHFPTFPDMSDPYKTRGKQPVIVSA
jgi:AraC-like DNA-binding protein